MALAAISDLAPGWLKRVQALNPIGEVGLAAVVVVLLCILIFPLPPFLLDVGLSLSITLGVLILMVALFLERPLDFTSFPTLLLLTTLFRLALEIATTRLILAHGHEGPAAAGHVVEAFGNFLMGGDFVIGLIVFVILLVVNFLVITKGSGRIAEVSARFVLDAMPGKQMAIDADLSSGMIDDKTARRRRKELEAESSFYGAMDGAARFVRGDAIAAIIILAVNVIGGLAIGIWRHGMGIADAATSFTTLTVGDGLVSQIPALLVSTAAGIVVTKGSIDGRADTALFREMGGDPKPLAMAAGVAATMALMPGLPALPFLGLAGATGGMAYLRHRAARRVEAAVTGEPAATPAEPPITEVLRVDLVRIELGYGLLGLAGGPQARLTEQIRGLRRSLAAELGFVMPAVRIQDNLQLKAEEYVIYVKEIEAGRAEIRAQGYLVMDARGEWPSFEGERVKEPAFGLPALWVSAAAKEEAISRGYTVVDPPTVLITHLAEIIKENMADLLSYTETQKLLDGLPAEWQKLVSDIVPSQISLGGIQRILQTLLAERVSIRDLPTILEAIQEATATPGRSFVQVVTQVRAKLARQISESLVGPNGYIPLLALSPEWERLFLESLVGSGDDRQLAVDPRKLQDFMQKFRAAYEKAQAGGETPVVITSPTLRPHLRAIIERIKPAVPVVSQLEIFPRVRIKTVGTI